MYTVGKKLQRDDDVATAETMTSQDTTNTGYDVTVTSPLLSSSSSSTAAATGDMLIRRRGLASTPLPAVLQIALAPPTAERDLFAPTEAPPTSLRVDISPAAVNLTAAVAGVGDISSTLSSGRITDYHSIDNRAMGYTTVQYSAVLAATDLIGKYT